MINLNVINGASTVLTYYQTVLVGKFKKDLIGVEMGIAYGGGTEQLGYLWKNLGKVYGYDTFEGHPDHLSKEKYSFEARCMDHWYNPALYGRKALSYDFQRMVLDTQNLDNVTLVKGLVNKDSCKDIPYINYALLDMDLEASMRTGFEAVYPKLVKGGFLFIHDAIPPEHIPGVHNWWFKEVMPQHKDLELIGQWPDQFLLGVEKK